MTMIPIFCPKCQTCVGIISAVSPAPEEGVVLATRTSLPRNGPNTTRRWRSGRRGCGVGLWKGDTRTSG
jgi:hypothetical protein